MKTFYSKHPLYCTSLRIHLLIPCGRKSLKRGIEIGTMGRGYVDRCGLYKMESERIKISDNERTRCEIWTRVMGYYRPVSAFNKGKKSEYKNRRYFKEDFDYHISVKARFS